MIGRALFDNVYYCYNNLLIDNIKMSPNISGDIFYYDLYIPYNR